MQSDKVEEIPCGTSGGAMIIFDKIEVVNRLKREYVYDTIKNYTTAYDTAMIFSKVLLLCESIIEPITTNTFVCTKNTEIRVNQRRVSVCPGKKGKLYSRYLLLTPSG